MAADGDVTAFLITIDTEGDNLWSRPREITTRNAGFLPAFQSLCERHGLRPTWLVNHEMACCPVFQEFGRDVLRRAAGEIGMHLHAWNSPPLVPLTEDDFRHQPFLTDYPPEAMRDKVHALTDRLEETFECPIVSHRAGRWAFDETYARVLAERGYRADCSVTPHVSWSGMRGAPGGHGGMDFTGAPEDPFVISAGDRELLEVPMTIRPVQRSVAGGRLREAGARIPLRFVRRVVDRLLPRVRWLRPDGWNRDALIGLVEEGVAEGRRHLEFMLHSSEFMPGGSPRFPSDSAIARLFEDLEALFSTVINCRCIAQTLAEFAEASLSEMKKPSAELSPPEPVAMR